MNKPSVRAGLRAKPVAIAVAAAFIPWLVPTAHAQIAADTLPTGGQVGAGAATISTSGSKMQIDQSTLRAILNWESFSIGSSAWVNFAQPSASAVALNRVVGNNPSQIFGQLTANGQVFLVNNAGVYFAPGASVSAAALVASTLSITDQNFLDGVYRFYNPCTGDPLCTLGGVVNEAGKDGALGSIVTAGGFTALIGPQVRNDGVIIANAGKVALAAGNRVSLDLIGDGLVSISVDEAAFNASVINTGTLQADGGTVLLKASSANSLLDTVINTSGVIRANALVERNGEIVLDGGGAVQVAGTLEALGGSVDINAAGALNVGSTVCCFPTTIQSRNQEITAGSLTIGGGATVRTAGDGDQTVATAGTLLVRGGILSGDVGLLHNGTGQQSITAGNLELRGGTGTNTGAFIRSDAGADQTVTVTGTLTVTGGASGTRNRAGLVSTGAQTINGNPDIVLTGGAGGGAGDLSNNVFIQALGGETKPQTVNARSIRINAGTGTDASATFNAAKQVITTLGDVSIFGSAGVGGSNGARIGGIGGTILGPTNLTLNVGGNLLLRGGAVNGASLGSSGASTQANTITVNAAGNITLESEGAGARIGSSNQTPVPVGNITLTAGSLDNPVGGSLQLGAGTAIRANGPITLTANSLTNDGTITNGGGANNQNVILIGNAFDLADGNIQAGAAGVFLRPRTSGHSFGIESAGDTTVTNADIGKINTSNFIAFGSGTANNLTGSLIIGQNALVNGGGKNLAFLRSLSPGGNATIGTHGVATSGDVIVSAGGGAIVSNGGTVSGDEVQLRATQGIGTPGARVNTNANALTIGTAGGAFVTEANDLTMRTIVLNLGGNTVLNTTNTGTGGVLDLAVGGNLNVAGPVNSGQGMTLNAGGAITVMAGGGVDAIVSSVGGQTISAHSVNLSAQDGRRAIIENQFSGDQTVSATAGDMNLQVPGAFGVAQIVNTAPGANQTVTVHGQLNVLGGVVSPTPTGSRNSGIFKQAAGGMQAVTASGITLQGASSLTQAGALISSVGDQLVDVTGGDINILGGNGGVINNAAILAGAASQQTVRARNITLANGVGGVDTVAAIQGGHQLIDLTGNLTLNSQEAILGTAAGGPGVRIGALQNTAAGSDVTLLVDGNVTINGGTVADNGAAIGSSGAGIAAPNKITIDAGGNVVLNAGTPSNTGVRIGSGSNGLAGGDISIKAGGSIELNGTQRNASIRTLDNVSLEAASITEQGSGVIIANGLALNAVGDVTLGGANQVTALSAPFVVPQPPATPRPGVGGNLTFNNAGPLAVNGAVETGGTMTLTVARALNVTGAGSQDAILRSRGGQTITAQSVNVSARDGRTAQLFNIAGDQRITAGSVDVETSTGGGLAEIRNNSAGSQTLTVAGGNLDIKGLGGGTAAVFGAGNQTIDTVGGGQITLGDHAALGQSLLSSNGDQTISGNADLTLTGGSGPLANGSNALITANNAARTQTINAGTLTMENSNLGGNSSVAAILGASQVITTTGDVIMTANASGGALPGVRIGGLGGGGAQATATNLTLNVGRDLRMTGGTLANNGVGIGSTASQIPAPANHININAYGDVILETRAAGSGARIGSSITNIGTGAGNITINAGGDIRLNGIVESTAIRTLDTVTLNAANISEAALGMIIAGTLNTNTSGSTLLTGTNAVSNFAGTAFGDLSFTNTGSLNVLSLVANNATLSNGGAVTLSGPWNSFGATSIGVDGDLNVNSFVHSTGPMTLSVDGAVRVVGSGLQDASLTSFGGQTINAGSLEVRSLDGRFATVGNNMNGDQTIAALGGGIEIDSVFGNGFAFITNSGTGSQFISASGGSGIQVRTSSGSGSSQINNFGAGNQTISVTGGGGVEVRTLSGTGFATISNSGAGSQTIAVTDGTGIDVVSGGGFAMISQNAPGLSQTLTALNADHINLDGRNGGATVFANGGAQTVSITGSGANAVTIGSSGAFGFSQFANASTQSVTAGLPGEQGSITITGPAANGASASIVSRPGLGGTQTISTSGLLSITGGTAPSQTFTSGVFHNGSGPQTITASDISIVGGPGGSGNRAQIGSFGGGVPANAGLQAINVAGGEIFVRGSDVGNTNTASIVSLADQTIDGNPDLVLIGGASAVAGVATANIASIQTALGRSQTIHARTIKMTNSAGANTDSFAGINASHQTITTTGDVVLTANGGSARIGGVGGGATDLQLNIGGDLRLDGGALPTNGTGIGSSGIGAAFANDINIVATGDVILNSGASGARIGSGAATGTAGGDISIRARSIQLNGTGASAAIRTLDSVTLQADSISEAGNAFVLANSLTTITSGNAHLTGPNRVSNFNASSGGDVNLNNSGLLNVTGMAALGDATITNVGDVTVSGLWDVDGTSTITAHSDIVISGVMSSPTVFLNASDGAILETPTGSITADTLTTFSLGETQLVGPNDVKVLNSESTGGLAFNNTAASFMLGTVETHGGAFSLAQAGDMTVTNAYAFREVNWAVAGSLALLGGSTAGSAAQISSEQPMNISVGGDLRLQGGSGAGAFARILGYSDINLTVGGFLTMQAGTGQDAWARIQTTSRDSVIYLTFPNLASGGFSINGYTDVLRDGKTGFLSENGAAALGHQLITIYGAQ